MDYKNCNKVALATIVQAIKDFYRGKLEEGEEFFESEWFSILCGCAGLDEELLRYEIKNTKSITRLQDLTVLEENLRT